MARVERDRRRVPTRRRSARVGGEDEPLFRAVGPGMITGAADDDPSAIGTYAAAGAKLGPAFLWTALVTFPMMFATELSSCGAAHVCPGHVFWYLTA